MFRVKYSEQKQSRLVKKQKRLVTVAVMLKVVYDSLNLQTFH